MCSRVRWLQPLWQNQRNIICGVRICVARCAAKFVELHWWFPPTASLCWWHGAQQVPPVHKLSQV